MKKIISLLMVVITACACISIIAPARVSAAGESASFKERFFSDGIDKITDVYYQIEKGNGEGNNGKPESIYMWFTQPDDIFEMLKDQAQKSDDEENWLEVYGLESFNFYIQLDCKIDDGDYRYYAGWDEAEYDETVDLPSDSVYYPSLGSEQNYEKKSFKRTYSIISASGGGDERGYFHGIIKGGSSGYYFDFVNHSMTLRVRYLIRYRNSGEEDQYMHSDWSEEVVLGKGGTQEELVEPTAIEAPIISELTYISGEVRDGIDMCKWSLKVEFPESNKQAERYFVVEKDAFEPLEAIIQYRVYKDNKWGIWRNAVMGNSTWLNSGIKEISTERAGQNDAIEVRAYLKNSVEGYNDSPYSTSILRNADKIEDGETPTVQPSDPTSDSSETKPATEKDKCKLCGICPVQPLGICLFIWLVIIIAVVVVALYIIKKNKDKENKNED